MDFQFHYDSELDILYFTRKGQEASAVEFAPEVTLELDAQGNIIGVEILNASTLLKDVIEPLREQALAA